MPFHLESLQESHLERLHRLFDSVCKERRFLAFSEAGSMDQTFTYYRSVIAGGHTHFVAIRGDDLLGWCDIVPPSGQMRAHVGVLGMAVAVAERGVGIGRALIEAAVARAANRGLTRIELTVHSENAAAQALYRSVGFEHEGTQKRGWQLDGQYFDIHHMARVI